MALGRIALASIKGIKQEVEREILGVMSINIEDAIQNGLLELKAYGGTEQRDLPSGYTQLNYITLNKGYFDTGITPTTDTDYELKFTVAQANTTQGVMGMLNNSTPTNNFYFMVSSGNKFLSALGTSAITLNDLPAVAVDTDYLVKVNGATLTVNGTAATNFNRGTLEATQTIDLGCRKNSENNGLTGKLYYFKIWKGGVLVAHYIPCKRNSDDVLGYYDIVNGTFGELLTQYGTPVAGSSTLTPTPDVPIALTCNNGILKFSKNMANINTQTVQLGYYISAQGVVTADPNNRIYKDFIPVLPNTTYTLSLSSSVYFVSISEYSTAEDSGFIVRKTGSTGSNTKLTITTGATTNYVRFGTNIDRTEITLEEVLAINWQLETGGIATPYLPYSETGYCVIGTTETIEDELGNTATAEMLLSVNTYKDEQEIISGEITRKVGVIVLNGTETWSKISNQNAYYTSSDNILYCNPVEAGFSNKFVGAGMATADMPDNSVKLTYTTSPNRGAILFKHNDTTTLEDWIQFVKDQYDAGDPIIALYPLATETTESVAGQTMNIPAGDSDIEITQASLNTLELSAKYRALPN